MTMGSAGFGHSKDHFRLCMHIVCDSSVQALLAGSQHSIGGI